MSMVAPICCERARPRAWSSEAVMARSLLRPSASAQPDCAVLGDGPAGVVRDLPDVAVGVGEGAGVTAPVGTGGRADDGAAGAGCFLEECVDGVVGADVVGELEAGGWLAAELGPEAEDHAAGLEEDDLVVGLVGAGPAEGFVERAGAAEVGGAEGDQADALLHGGSVRGWRAG